MFDIQHDSPVPIAEQITDQIRAHIASGALKADERLAEYCALAKEILTNPQMVARAYRELEIEGVLKKAPTGDMKVTAGAAAICQERLREMARCRIRAATSQGLAQGLTEAEIVRAVTEELAAVRGRALAPNEVLTAIKKSTDEFSYRVNQGIQDLSRKNRPGSA